MSNILRNKKILIPVIGVVLAIVAYLGFSYAAPLENDVEVAPNTDLTYYLNVYYDGVDRNGVKSNDSTVASINSGYMQVTDKIPDGLIFQGFVTTSDGTIGAVRRSNENTSCLGKVVDDTNEASVTDGVWNNGNTEYTYHGLHYDAATRTVSFKVKNLQAGCKLTVGIKTKTPMTIDNPDTTEIEKRRDFYNYGSVKEDSLTVISNIVHVYMGKDDIPLFNVSYQYSGTVPTNAPAAPGTNGYPAGSRVGVAAPVNIEGYTFSGWTTGGATVSDGSFTMPSSNVVFTGSFTAISKFNVSYTITGTAPEGYVVPTTKSYYPDATVNVDSLKDGDVINGYRFKGWTTSSVTISEENNFIMPSQNVTLTGRFEEVTYTVSYEFYDTVLPPNSDNLLPPTSTYKPGVRVNLSDVNDLNGYKFLGWYKEDNFVMPEEDITIYGEWMLQAGTFEPLIEKHQRLAKDYYKVGDTIYYYIDVTNTASYAIHDVIIKDDLDGITFTSGYNNYEILSDHYAKIPQILAGRTERVYATYDVKATDTNKVINEAEIVGALADNNYVLKEGEYKATDTANLASGVTICKNISGPSIPNKFQFHVTGSNNYDTWVVLEEDECKVLYLAPGTYQIMEIVPQEYNISSISGIASNGGSLTVVQGQSYNVTFTNTFVRKGYYHSFGRIENNVSYFEVG